jgi:hypothetical protein
MTQQLLLAYPPTVRINIISNQSLRTQNLKQQHYGFMA